MPELWQLAANWLKDTGALPADSPSVGAGARVYDLALALQDGTVLCDALNRLCPNSVATINQKPEKQFLKMQNINSFLAACQTQFGLKEADLFSADQLYYASDFPRVITVISLLSKTQIAGLGGFKYFPQDASGTKNVADDGQGEDMYQTLEDLVGQSLSFQEASADLAAYDPDRKEDEEDTDIYGSIQNVIEGGSEDVYTNLLYAEGKEESIYSALGGDDKRSCVLAELLETERNYVGVLRTIIDVFMKQLAAQPKIITKADHRIIFSNITDLLAAHVEFYDRLEKQLASTTGRIVSDCFLQSMKSFRCYGQFCCEIPDAISKLKELVTKPPAAKILDTARKDSGQRFPLKDLLNVPMQRVLKYPLLLKELIKSTPDSHPDKQNLTVAYSAVQDLAKFINDTKKDHDNLKQMVSSLKQYTGKPLQEYGSLVRDGDLMHKIDGGKDKLKERYIFLFTSAIIFCKPKGTFFFFKETFELDDACEIVDMENPPKDDADGKFTFCWALKRKGEVQVFAAKSLAAKKKWVGSMQANLDFIKDKVAGPPSIAPRTATITPGSMQLSPPSTPSPATAPRPASTAASLAPPKASAGSTPSSSAASTPTSAAPPKDKKKSYEQWVPLAPGAAPAAAAPAPAAASAAAADAEGARVAAEVTKRSGDEGWFAGKMPRAKAEKLLEESPDGTFLVRESDSRPGDYSLSVRYRIVKHIKINRHGNKYDLAPDSKSFPSIQELVEHFQQHSLNRHFPGMETTLAIPFKDAVSRSSGGASTGTAPRAMGIGRARSRFAYVAKSHDELSFERGVEICILSTQDVDPGWWKGMLPTGQIGIFPANHVQQL